MTKTQVTKQEERYQGQTAKGISDNAITLKSTSTPTATTGTHAFLGCRKPALLDQPGTEEARVPPHTPAGLMMTPGSLCTSPINLRGCSPNYSNQLRRLMN